MSQIEIVVKCIGVSRSGVDGWQLVELAASAWQPNPAAPSHSLGFYSPTPGFAQKFHISLVSTYLPARGDGVFANAIFDQNNLFIFWEAYCVHWCLNESQYVILMILSDCPTDTYIGYSSFCIVFLMEPRPLFIRVRDGSVLFK